MVIYAIAVIPLPHMQIDQAEKLSGNRTKSVAYVDEFTGAGSITKLFYWGNTLTILDPLFGYHPNKLNVG